MNLFPFRQTITDPVVIVQDTRDTTSEFHYRGEKMLGNFVLVHPKTPREIYALQTLKHRVEKWAQKDGTGVVLTLEASENFK